MTPLEELDAPIVKLPPIGVSSGAGRFAHALCGSSDAALSRKRLSEMLGGAEIISSAKTCSHGRAQDQ